MYKKALFPIYIFQNNIRENNLIKDEVYTKIEDFRKRQSLEIPEGWLTDNLYTSFKYLDLNNQIFNGTKTMDTYIRYIEKFFDLEVEVEVENMWFNCYSNGEWQEVHGHQNESPFMYPATFSCIHFLSFDPNIHNPVVFVDPNERLRGFDLDSNNYTSRYVPKIREGDLVMFPSYLQHFVPKGRPTPQKPRISVAFNLRLLRYGNQRREDYQLQR